MQLTIYKKTSIITRHVEGEKVQAIAYGWGRHLGIIMPVIVMNHHSKCSASEISMIVKLRKNLRDVIVILS